MATSKIESKAKGVVLATFTANNQTKTFTEPLTNFSKVTVNAYVVDGGGEYLLNTVEFFPQVHIPENVIVAFHDGTIRKFQLRDLSTTQATNNYFTGVNKAEVIGIK